MNRNTFSELSETDPCKFTPVQQKLAIMITSRELRQQRINEKKAKLTKLAIQKIMRQDEENDRSHQKRMILDLDL